MFHPDQWERLLCETFVQSCDYHDQLHSTNDHALQHMHHAARELPRLVITDQQTRGRGRQGNHWQAPPGALTFSLLVDLSRYGLARDRVPLVALWAGLGIRDALARCVPGERIQVKWPNDVYLNDRKVCGILVEGTSAMADRVVVGIGVNVNNRFDEHGPSTILDHSSTDLSHDAAALRFPAVSLADVVGTQDRLEVLIRVLQGLEAAWNLCAQQRAALPELWRAHCWLSGRRVSCRAGADMWEGICQGIDEEGRLMLDRGTEIHRCLGGTIDLVDG
jgi:BirA family biotin operon repressor/biotin-[acetyl-CoA-carboxylase] ligase